jgi:hypothetical protein
MSWQAIAMMVLMIGLYFGGLIYFALKHKHKQSGKKSQ